MICPEKENATDAVSRYCSCRMAPWPFQWTITPERQAQGLATPALAAGRCFVRWKDETGWPEGKIHLVSEGAIIPLVLRDKNMLSNL
jgi:hypothetical protein